MKIVIPEYKTLDLNMIFLDFNGTIAVDGVVPESVKERIRVLANDFRIYVLTADTHGNAKEQCADIPVILHTFPSGSARDYKKEILKSMGSKHCVAIGNGRNDELMLKEAALSIGVMDKEGMCSGVFRTADLIVRSMEEAFDLLIHPSRVIAGLRG